MILPGITKPPVGLHSRVRCVKPGLGCQPLSHVCFGTTWHPLIQLPSGLLHHQTGSIQPGSGLSQRKSNPLIFTNRSAEHHPLIGVRHRSRQRSTTNSYCFCGNQDSFSIQSVQQIAKAFTLFSHPIGFNHLQLIVNHLTGSHRIATKLFNRGNGHLRTLEFGEQQRHPVGFSLNFLLALCSNEK